MSITYFHNGAYDVSDAMDAMNRIDEEIEEKSGSGELTDEELSKLYYQKMIQGLKLNTGFVQL